MPTESRLEYNRRWIKNNPDKVKEYYKRSNKKVTKEKKKEYNDRSNKKITKEKKKEYNAKYFSTERGKERRYFHVKTRIHQKHAGGGVFSGKDWDYIRWLFDDRCAYCGKKTEKLQIEHIVPLSRGGVHDSSNIVPACQKCNFEKGTRSMLEFLVRRSERLFSAKENTNG